MYYSVLGHSKDLVDAMSAFGVRGHCEGLLLLRISAIVIQWTFMNFLLTNIIMMRQDTIFIDKYEIPEKRKSKPLLIIKDCMEKAYVNVFL